LTKEDLPFAGTTTVALATDFGVDDIKSRLTREILEILEGESESGFHGTRERVPKQRMSGIEQAMAEYKRSDARQHAERSRAASGQQAIQHGPR